MDDYLTAIEIQTEKLDHLIRHAQRALQQATILAISLNGGEELAGALKDIEFEFFNKCVTEKQMLLHRHLIRLDPNFEPITKMPAPDSVIPDAYTSQASPKFPVDIGRHD